MCLQAHWGPAWRPYGPATSTDRRRLNRLSASELSILPNLPVNRQRGFPRLAVWRLLAGETLVDVSPLGLFSYWIFTAKMMTADWLGVRVPTVALMVSAVPLAGAVIVPIVVLAGGLLVKSVNAGVASLTTTLVMLAAPELVAVIR